MEKGSQAKNPLKYLPAKTIPAHILVRTYHEPTISQAIGELLDHLQQGEFAEIPSIKFTPVSYTHLTLPTSDLV